MLFLPIVLVLPLASAATAPWREKHLSAGARIKQLPVAEPKVLSSVAELSSRRGLQTAGASHGSPLPP